MKYRDEIDDLRALAVVPIISFHAGIGCLEVNLFGVNVFFVTSGCLVTMF